MYRLGMTKTKEGKMRMKVNNKDIIIIISLIALSAISLALTLVDAHAEKSEIAALPEDNIITTTLANGTIVQNLTASPPPVEINLCPDNDFDGKCGVEGSNSSK